MALLELDDKVYKIPNKVMKAFEDMSDYIKDLKEKNKTFEDYNKDLNNQLDKLKEEKEELKSALDEQENINANLSRRILKAIKYMKHYIKVEDAPINERIKIEFKEVLKILKGEKNDKD